MSSLNQNVIRHKIGLLNLATELGNISRACKLMGLSRDTFYRYRNAMADGGMEALFDANRQRPERQGCRGLRIRRKPKAKRWPDEQEADTRRRSGVRWPISSKPDTCTECYDIYPTGISMKVSAQYPRRSACGHVLPTSRGVGKRMQKSAEGVGRGRSGEPEKNHDRRPEH